MMKDFTTIDLQGYDGVVIVDLPGDGQGSISLRNRVEANPALDELDELTVNEVTHRIALGEFTVNTNCHEPTKCGDGRGVAGKIARQGTQLFGATAGLAKTLRIAELSGSNATAAEDIADLVKQRNAKGLLSGAHRADVHGKVGVCGCGECDGADVAAQLIASSRERVLEFTKTLFEGLGIGPRIGVAEELDINIFNQNADMVTELQHSGYFKNGPAMVNAVDKSEPEVNNIEQLVGEHQEIVWVINLKEQTTFDREAFLEEFAGRQVMAFWEDQWAVEKELATYTNSSEELNRAIIADLIRRLITADNLTAADLRLMILN